MKIKWARAMIDDKIQPKNILIYGAGAIGSFMGYLLSYPPSEDGAAIENVAMLGRPGHMEKIRSEGLQVETPEGIKQVHFRHLFTNLDELEASDFCPEIVLISVKTYSLERLCQELESIGPAGGEAEGCPIPAADERHGKRRAIPGARPPGLGKDF